MDTTRTAPAALPTADIAGSLAAWARDAARWLAAQALDDRSAHLAAAVDHEDLLRRERDCTAFERACAQIPRYH